jgi:hypothetical protein
MFLSLDHVPRRVVVGNGMLFLLSKIPHWSRIAIVELRLRYTVEVTISGPQQYQSTRASTPTKKKMQKKKNEGFYSPTFPMAHGYSPVHATYQSPRAATRLRSGSSGSGTQQQQQQQRQQQ